ERIGEGEAEPVRAAAVTAGEQQRHGLHPGVHNQRPAVAAVAEGLVAHPLYLDLAVEAQISLVVVDDDVVEVERGDASAGRSRGSSDLEHRLAFIGKRRPEAGEFSILSTLQ